MRRDRRRAHWKLQTPNVVLCSKCREPVLSHTVCKACGNYGGKTVIATAE